MKINDRNNSHKQFLKSACILFPFSDFVFYAINSIIKYSLCSKSRKPKVKGFNYFQINFLAFKRTFKTSSLETLSFEYNSNLINIKIPSPVNLEYFMMHSHTVLKTLTAVINKYLDTLKRNLIVWSIGRLFHGSHGYKPLSWLKLSRKRTLRLKDILES